MLHICLIHSHILIYINCLWPLAWKRFAVFNILPLVPKFADTVDCSYEYPIGSQDVCRIFLSFHSLTPVK